MAFKNLSNEEMTAVSSAWVDPNNPAQLALRSKESLLGLSAEVNRRHAALLALIASPDDDEERLTAIERATELDRRHDGLASAIYGYLSALAQMTDGGEALLTLRDALMPEGLGAVVHASYRGQAGFAAAVNNRLGAAQRAQLASLELPEGSLWDKVEAWLSTGTALGELEEQRARAEAERLRTTSTQVITARNEWIRMAKALLAVAELSQLDPKQEDLIFGPLRDAESTADQRAARRLAAAEARRRPVSDVAPRPSAGAQQNKTETG